MPLEVFFKHGSPCRSSIYIYGRSQLGGRGGEGREKAFGERGRSNSGQRVAPTSTAHTIIERRYTLTNTHEYTDQTHS